MNDTKTILSNLATVAEIDPRGLRQALKSLAPSWIPKAGNPGIPNIEYTKTKSPKWRSLSLLVAKILTGKAVSSALIRELAEMHETDSPASTKSTRKTTSTKKTPKKRTMNYKAEQCAKRYKSDKGKTPMKTIVEEYVDEFGGSVHSILKVLTDNPTTWKTTVKTTRKTT
ncbi:MAG: hypothetical protein ACK5PB_21145 [Pirellula sp.]|jgi:hypothetical protein